MLYPSKIDHVCKLHRFYCVDRVGCTVHIRVLLPYHNITSTEYVTILHTAWRTCPAIRTALQAGHFACIHRLRRLQCTTGIQKRCVMAWHSVRAPAWP